MNSCDAGIYEAAGVRQQVARKYREETSREKTPWLTNSISSSPTPNPLCPATPARAAAKRCAPIWKKLLGNPTSSANTPARSPAGLKVLYEDPKLGFQVLAHIKRQGAHLATDDHGASWAIYGQATH